MSLQTDAFNKGFGTVLLQERKEFTLQVPKAEEGFLAIQKELLGVAWGLEMFHHFFIEENSWYKLITNHLKSYSKDPSLNPHHALSKS